MVRFHLRAPKQQLKSLFLINIDMPDKLTKVYAEILRALPLLALLGTSIMWVDTRYMHKEISDTRFIELQIRIVERNIKDYHRMIEDGVVLSPSDQMELEMEQDQLKFLRNERNKILDLGGLPE